MMSKNLAYAITLPVVAVVAFGIIVSSRSHLRDAPAPPDLSGPSPTLSPAPENAPPPARPVPESPSSDPVVQFNRAAARNQRHVTE